MIYLLIIVNKIILIIFSVLFHFIFIIHCTFYFVIFYFHYLLYFLFYFIFIIHCTFYFVMFYFHYLLYFLFYFIFIIHCTFYFVIFYFHYLLYFLFYFTFFNSILIVSQSIFSTSTLSDFHRTAYDFAKRNRDTIINVGFGFKWWKGFNASSICDLLFYFIETHRSLSKIFLHHVEQLFLSDYCKNVVAEQFLFVTESHNGFKETSSSPRTLKICWFDSFSPICWILNITRNIL